MTDPYAETDDWPTVPATRPHSDTQPVSAPEPSGSTPEAGEGARVAAYAEAVALSEGVTPGTDPWHDAAARAVMAVADQETAELRAEVERLRRELAEETEAHRADLLADIEEGQDASDALIEALSRAEAAEAESARLASEQRELAAQVAGLRSVVAKVEALTYDWPCSDDACDGDCTGCAYAADLRAALASAGVSGSADDRREANASQAPDTATPGEARCRGEGETCLTHGGGWIFNDDGTADVCESADLYPAASSVDDKEGEQR